MTLGSIIGLLTSSIYWDFPGDGNAYLCAIGFGTLLGAAVGAYIACANRWPRRITALLVALAPSLCLIGASVGIPTLTDIPALLALPLLATLLRRKTARATLRVNPITAALAAYAVCVIPSTILSQSLEDAIASLLPLALFFIGMLLQSGPPGAAVGFERARLLRLLAPAILCGGILLAFVEHFVQPTDAVAQVCALSMGALILLATTWDTRRFFWRVVLGFPDKSVRVATAGLILSFLITMSVVLTHLATPGIVVALALALAVVAILRRRFGEIAALCISSAPLLSGFGLDWLRKPLLSLSTALDGHAWSSALSAAVSTPFGGGFKGAADYGFYQRTIATLGFQGLVAIMAAMALTVIMCVRTYAKLRPSSGEAGGILTAGALCIFFGAAGFFTDSLAAPALAMLSWLFIGMANGTIEGVRLATIGDHAQSAEARASVEQLRGYPLRIAYVLPGDATGEAALAFGDYLHSFDRSRVQPLLLAMGNGALASLAQGLGVETRIVKSIARPHRGSANGESSRMRFGALRRPFSMLIRSIDLRRWTLRRTALLVLAALELEPDLLVSLDASLHASTLSAARTVGVPLQWHARDIATRRMQRALDTLAPWTAGILAPSQTIARSYSLRRVGVRMRVLRPSLLLDSAPIANRHAVRRQLGIPDDAHFLTILGQITAKSGHQDVLDALVYLLEDHPNLRVALLEEAAPQALLEEESSPAARILASATEAGSEIALRTARLHSAITADRLETIVTLLGQRADALDILAASDIVLLPHERPTGSRNILMALAAGVPLVATRIGTHAELLADAWGFMMVKPHDPEGIAISIDAMLQQYDLYRMNAQRNPALVRNLFAPPLEMARLQRIYSDLCQPNGQTLRLPSPRDIAGPLPRHWLTAFLEPLAAE